MKKKSFYEEYYEMKKDERKITNLSSHEAYTLVGQLNRSTRSVKGGYRFVTRRMLIDNKEVSVVMRQS